MTRAEILKQARETKKLKKQLEDNNLFLEIPVKLESYGLDQENEQEPEIKQEPIFIEVNSTDKIKYKALLSKAISYQFKPNEIEFISDKNDIYSITTESNIVCIVGDHRFLRRFYSNTKISFIMDYKLLLNIPSTDLESNIVQLFLFRKIHKVTNIR